ncbi:hypothetical protein [Altericista sp. CCNU0014]|uniref:hypothetical protein n=1 Tax=Altericista sp. CCNU0014 TaxID=3082949 RepID=UPI00384B922A
MKIRYTKFFVIALLFIFLITFPVLSQSTSYRATVNRFGGSQIGKTIQAGTPNDLANRIYTAIRPSNSPLPKINISMGTVNLSAFRNTVQSKGISADYYEFIGGATVSKSPWQQINISSIRPSSTIYGVLFSKNGYRSVTVTQIPFRVRIIKNGDPILQFNSLVTTLVDGSIIDYTLDTNNSGIQSEWLNQHIESRDSRLRLRVLSDLDRQMINNCRSMPMVQQDCPSPPKYSIRLFRG